MIQKSNLLVNSTRVNKKIMYYKSVGQPWLYSEEESVVTSTVELTPENHADHTYPVDGWYWYSSDDEAAAAFKANYPDSGNGGVGPQGPIGLTGPQGPAGPSAVSTDAGQLATLGTDSLILVAITPADIGAAADDADLADFTSGTAASGQVPTADGTGGVAWDDVASGSGDVVGPASATDNALARFDTTGKLLQNSNATLADNGVMTLTGPGAAGTTTLEIKPATGTSYTRILDNGTMEINADATTGGQPLSIKYNGSNCAKLNYLGDLQLYGGLTCTKLNMDGGTIWLDTNGLGVLEQVQSTYLQSYRLYATYTSATSYHRLTTATAKQTLSNVSGASVSTTGGLIPAGANLLGVTTRINTALGTGNGTTGYAVGTATDPNLWGDVTAVAAGTASKASPIAAESSGYTAADAVGLRLTAQDVTLTAAGGNFNGTGVIEVCAYYSLAEAD